MFVQSHVRDSPAERASNVLRVRPDTIAPMMGSSKDRCAPRRAQCVVSRRRSAWLGLLLPLVDISCANPRAVPVSTMPTAASAGSTEANPMPASTALPAASESEPVVRIGAKHRYASAVLQDDVPIGSICRMSTSRASIALVGPSTSRLTHLLLTLPPHTHRMSGGGASRARGSLSGPRDGYVERRASPR